jgi:hypothetical protein
LRLCGAPHKRNYAERTIMWSPILTDPDFSLLSTG